MGKLSDRVRPGSEAAPWVVLEIGKLEAEIERLQKWQREMVEKAADKSLDGYRELGAKCASMASERDEMEKKARLFAGWAADGCTCEHDRDDGIPTPCVPCQARAFLQRAKPTGPSPAEPEVTALMKAVETDLEMHDASWRDVYERFQTGYTLTHEDRELLLCYAATITELRDAMDAARKRWPM